MSQAQVFLDGEADAYHQRNLAHYAAYSIEDDVVAQQIERSDLLPRSIVDLGCCRGERLSALCAKYAASGTGADASAAAIAAATQRDAQVRWMVADWTDLLLPGTDLIITSYVWHWVDRAKLLRAMANVHDSLAVGGHLIINDWWMPAVDVPYKHAPGVMTYKRTYDAMFLTTGLYRWRSRLRGFYKDTDEPTACTVLQRVS